MAGESSLGKRILIASNGATFPRGMEIAVELNRTLGKDAGMRLDHWTITSERENDSQFHLKRVARFVGAETSGALIVVNGITPAAQYDNDVFLEEAAMARFRGLPTFADQLPEIPELPPHDDLHGMSLQLRVMGVLQYSAAAVGSLDFPPPAR